MDIKIPYGRVEITLSLLEDRVRKVLRSKVEDYKAPGTGEELVKAALESPVDSSRLRELARNANRILVITSDHTRPVPSRTTLPILLEEIRGGNPHAEIKILIATGFHRPTTYEEMIEKFGREIVENEVIINHDCKKKEDMVYKGVLPSGGALWLNSLVNWADLTVAEGFIEPHFFAGFSGGRKSILPGIAGEKTVLANHCSEFIASPFARTGNLTGNPIHRDMLYASEAAGLKFILNVVLNGKKEIIGAFAGDPVKAHEEGCSFVKGLAMLNAVEGDIVITSNGGYPLDQNIYQAVKGMTAAEACVKPGGVIIMVASCIDGHGGRDFYRWFADASSPKEVAKKISSIPREETLPDQWEAQILARVLMRADVIMVADECSRGFIENMHMKYASSLEQALEAAERKVGRNSDIVVIPDGVSVILQTDYSCD